MTSVRAGYRSNDAIRRREQARHAGEPPSAAGVQRAVITQAETSAERAWPAEVASVASVQSVRDAHRAYQDFFDSITERRKGRRVGRPRFESRKDSRQPFRLTRNGFALRPNGKPYLAKIGDGQVRWSRDLPSEPSSVTIVREPDGHCYASFVVEIASRPPALTGTEAGIDLGIARLATVVDTLGRRRDIPNPKYLRRAQRKLARLEREKSRRAEGSANRAKARRTVAVQHGEVARSRRDYHHEQALALVRENQAVYVEDLNIAGLVANHSLTRSIHDAGWSRFVRLIEEKAERHGRTVVKVSRWLPSSRACSSCGPRVDRMPLEIRTWTCPACGAMHDRDHNASRNVLAAGQAERLNACGAPVRPSARVARCDETGSLPDAS